MSYLRCVENFLISSSGRIKKVFGSFFSSKNRAAERKGEEMKRKEKTKPKRTKIEWCACG
jgi:hypothetical protein